MPVPAVDFYSVPIRDRRLIYAPLHRLAALVDRNAAEEIRAGVESGASVQGTIAPILERLRSAGSDPPEHREGALDDPLFLGLIPTRGCHLGCRYCDFPASLPGSPVMALGLARHAIDAYLGLVASHGRDRAEVHFFGGEPFDAEEVVHFAVEYASMCAAKLGLAIRFEVTTNGAYSETRCEWIADHFDSVVLSLDGPPDVQDRQRPKLGGGGSSAIVTRSARILSAGTCELILRACVAQESVGRMEETARWMGQEFVTSTVCFESLVPNPRSEEAGLAPPDPWEFARNFLLASRLLGAKGIEAVLATADLRSCRAYLCPVGRDALIVSPDGAVDACYLPCASWRGLDLHLGSVHGPRIDIDGESLRRVRSLSVLDERLCADCLCRYHCVGGCRVGHDTGRPPGEYDAICIQTRIVTFGQLLDRLGQREAVDEWLADRTALEASVWRPSDRLFDGSES